jgi:hypothetical protein
VPVGGAHAAPLDVARAVMAHVNLVPPLDTVRTAIAHVKLRVDVVAVAHRVMGARRVGHIDPPSHHLLTQLQKQVGVAGGAWRLSRAEVAVKVPCYD